jgi:diadenylate cyclase
MFPTTNSQCDFSPVKQQLKADMELVSSRIAQSLATLDNNDCCILGELESIKEKFLQIEARAATFYLNCYLSPFTDKYNDLSLCIQHLSERRHGALIAVEREDPLDLMVHSGTPIGAEVSHSLMESIFYPGSPLHDGAVLVRSNLIASAQNILPLSKIAQISRKLGTRHRAAIGLTEQSDAIVLVVSEETGKASFAVGGILYPVTS